jgi:hypothetical protein
VKLAGKTMFPTLDTITNSVLETSLDTFNDPRRSVRQGSVLILREDFLPDQRFYSVGGINQIIPGCRVDIESHHDIEQEYGDERYENEKDKERRQYFTAQRFHP